MEFRVFKGRECSLWCSSLERGVLGVAPFKPAMVAGDGKARDLVHHLIDFLMELEWRQTQGPA